MTSRKGRMEVRQKQLNILAEELKETEDEMIDKGPRQSGCTTF